ncbi:MAG: hypothetical protein H8E26_00870 [FCB group bacterium]|nr:hypothetical protein [FCB group bacterium]MBL7028703.1 hypothetical protein [Candidatus Neomarinimicrobiota bacterium]MBL7120693.1 hypothetical protein [Candidatus Neomarinimicrobiota bacterium]
MIWGFKTVAAIDIWTVEHFLSGISIGMLVLSINSKLMLKHFNVSREKIRTSHFDIIAVLLLAYLWETLEHYLETGLAGAMVEYWLQGVEFWANRLIFDPLVTVVGYYLAKSYPILVNPARALSLLWLIVHIFVFPHSMYLHDFF